MGCPFCPICYTPVRGVFALQADNAFTVGSVVVCSSCAGISQLQADRQLHALTHAEIEAASGDDRAAIYAAREKLVDEWIKSGTPPTIYAWVMVEMRRKKERERKQ